MSFDFLRSSSSPSSAFRVVCGEMVLDEKWNVHNEVVLALVKTGSMTLETATTAVSLHQGDIYVFNANTSLIHQYHGRDAGDLTI